jgi:hypoxanthine phosphoribosyltransferase
MTGIIPLITTTDIITRVHDLGKEITNAYRGKEPVLIGSLKGSFVFLADLCRRIDLPLSIDFVGASSYHDGTESTGKIMITKKPDESVEGKDVLLVEDIVDTGRTASYWIKWFEDAGANSVKTCSLLYKPSRNIIKVEIHFLGFIIEDKFVVGYGLDFAQQYRNLPYIGVLNQ